MDAYVCISCVTVHIYKHTCTCSHIHEHTERDSHMQHACMYYNIIIAIMYLFYTLDNIFHYNESSTMPITESLDIFGELRIQIKKKLKDIYIDCTMP